MKRALYTEQGKVVAMLEDGTVKKTVTESQHLVRFPEALSGWAFDTVLIQQAAELGAERIDVWAKDTNQHYYVGVDEFCQKAVPLNRKFGAQLLLPLRYWNPVDTRQMALL